MRRRIGAGLAAVMTLTVAAMAQTDPVPMMPEVPDDYPPVMGAVTATVGGRALTWQTYDFSIGAFDASAWVGDTDDNVTLHIMAYPEGQPEKMEDRLHIVAEFGLFPSPGGPADTVLIEVLGEKDIDGRKLTSGTTPVVFTLEEFTRSSYAYGHARGRFEATLCLKRSKTAQVSRKCQQIRGRFDTDIQFDNM